MLKYHVRLYLIINPLNNVNSKIDIVSVSLSVIWLNRDLA